MKITYSIWYEDNL